MKRAVKWTNTALIVGFAALLAGPNLLWPILRGSCDTVNHENRTLASFPDAESSLTQWPTAFEAWLSDNAPFRNEMLVLKAEVDRSIGTLDSSDVLQGKDGWLFLKDVGDSKSISDYQGLTAYSDAEKAELSALIQQLNDELSARGSRLLILFAPAKEGVYSDRMPASIPIVSRPTQVQELSTYLQANTTCPVLFPLPELTEAAAAQQVYYKYDTHWNNAGAWLAAQKTLAALDMPAAQDWPLFLTEPEIPCPADLAAMCGRWNMASDDVYLEPDVPTAERIEGSDGAELMRFSGSGSNSLLLARDSYGAALAPYLAEGFHDTLVLHGNVLTVDTLLAEQTTIPDTVVIEVAERFCGDLTGRVKVLLAWLENC